MCQVIVSNKAEKVLAKLSNTVYSRLTLALAKLSIDPRPPIVKNSKAVKPGAFVWVITESSMKLRMANLS